MFVILLICQIAGIIILLGVFVLLFKRIVLIDAQTRQPTSFEFPLLGKVRTQTPLVIPILLSAVLLLLPITVSQRLEESTKYLKGTIIGKLYQPEVLIVGNPDFTARVDVSGETGQFSAYVPLLKKKMTYNVVVLENRRQIGSVTIADSDDWGKIRIVIQESLTAVPEAAPKKLFVLSPASQ